MTQSESSIVFTSEWIQTMEKRYGNRSRSLKSWPYLIATDDEFFPIRQRVENWVADLPEAGRGKMIPNLRSTDNFWHACHELAVGSFLKELGLQVEFEKLFGEQTSDWFVCPANGLPPFIVEVFTVNVSESDFFENNQLDDLTRRLGEIPLDFAVKISCEDDSAIRQLDSKRNKKIAEAVRMWLQTHNLLSEPSFSLEGFTFEIIHRNRGYPTVQYASITKPTYAAWTPLREKIEEKIHKYKNIVLSNKIPLIVAVARGLGTDYSNFEMKNILLGGVFTESPLSNGLFTKEPLLSGVLFVERSGMAEWKIQNYPNLKATFPLPKGIFAEKSPEAIES
jgi:hypothetical protein